MTERERAEAEVAEKERALTDAFEAPGGSWYDVPPSMVREGFADVAESGVNALKDLLIGATIGADPSTRTEPVWDQPMDWQELGEVGSLAMAPLAVGGRALLKRITNPIRTFHGSPHVFEQPYRFDLDKIGTGEGAQAYGHGGYFAENPTVARGYQPRNAQREEILLRMAQDAERAQDYGAYGVIEDAMLHRPPEELRAMHGPEFEELIKRIESLPQTGGVYDVDLHVDPEQLLDWDASVAEQPERVREALQGVRGSADVSSPLDHVSSSDFDNWRGGTAYYRVSRPPNSPNRGRGDFGEVQRSASEKLQSVDVPGLRYWDQGSRDHRRGTRNYVIWDPEVIDIRKKLAALLAVGGGATAADAFDQTPVEFGR